MGVNPNRKSVGRESAVYCAASVRLADVAGEPLEGQRKIHSYFRALWKPYIWLGPCAREGNGKPL